MISEYAKSYCCEDISKIENYDKALSSSEQYVCHHKLGIELSKSREELDKLGLYFNRPACELVFMTVSEHMKLHSQNQREDTKNQISNTLKIKFNSPEMHQLFVNQNGGENNPMYGHIWTDEQLEHCRQGALKRDNTNIGKYERTPEINKKTSKSLKGKMAGDKNPMYGKRGKDNPNYGLHWYNNGEISIKARECPEGFKPGRIYNRKYE